MAPNYVLPRNDKEWSCSDKNGAFTLIETLIVVLIIGVMIAVTVLMFHNFGRERRQKIAIERLQTVINAARDRALYLPAVIGMRVDKQGFKFFRFRQDRQRWQALSPDDLSDPHAFKDNVKLKIKSSQTLLNTKGSPQILILPDGHVTPFELLISKVYRINVSADGVVLWQRRTLSLRGTK